jgi:hypothetical protein
MPKHVTAKQIFLVGNDTFVNSPAPAGPFLAIFEDDEDTGYFYAIDTRGGDKPIRDAVLIYQVADVKNREHWRELAIAWSDDNRKVMLAIDGIPHAVFDFAAKQGYCRTGYPRAGTRGGWSHRGHAWNESVVAQFD